MALIRLLQYKPDGEIVFREPTSGNVPAYATLSHTWEKEEVLFQDMEAGADRSRTMNRAGWRKIEFCAKQAAADGLQYFWVDTCCIDKKNAVELGAAINSMFRWYRNAARCYVYLSDVSKPATRTDDKKAWEEDFRASRWFTRGWTLQELIAPRLVDFFSLEGQQLGSKSTLETKIHNITGIAKNALQGDALSNFSIKERRSWAERRTTTIEEDGTYCLIGIFDVSMVPNYGEGRDHAFRRLEEEIHRLYKGIEFEKFAVGLDLTSFPEAAQFVAREKELSEMHKLLYGHSGRACVVLHGLGGIGKTQLAITYARRHKEKHTAIFWLNANDDDSLKLGFRDIAQQVLRHHRSTGLLASVNLDGDLDRVVNSVKDWLDLPMNTRWLIIYDNYDNPKMSGGLDDLAVDLHRYLPRSDHGSIIITTRSSQVSLSHRIHVQKLQSIQDGLEILSNTSRREGIKDDPDAVKLVKELDGLPLALSTAGAYLEHVTTSFSEYLRLYKASWLKLQTTSPKLNSYEDRALYSTWQTTFDLIEQKNTASAKLLKLWAYFDREDVYFDLLRHANSADDEWLQRLTEDELNFNMAVTLLCSFGLVDPHWSHQLQFGSGGYSVHSCVHSWTTFVLNHEWDERLAQVALTCVASEIPMRDVRDSWMLQRRLLQHASRQERLISGGKVDVEGMEWALDMLGVLYADQGKLAEAEAMYSKLAEAEAMYSRALQGYEEALSPQLLPSYLPALNTMFAFGDLFSQTDRKDLAKAMYSQALSGYTSIQGPSSKSCQQLKDRLHTLQVAPAASETSKDKSTEVGAHKSSTLKQKFCKLGRRLNIR
ncbi:HET-domain-containing protein [Lojkania enalia]|uniref:HET-domain-containing protein n=1 Tax=Lojkania enalia TaxID=147567 RepID=A0A9P4MVK8_9PLEO|nr:HET-domain-containing protein [Didymosphaeria enalia]